MTELERIIHVLNFKDENKELGMDMVLLIAVGKLGECNLTSMHEFTDRGYDAIRIRVKNVLVPDGYLLEGEHVKGANGKMLKTYRLSVKAEKKLVRFLAMDQKTSGRATLTRKVKV